jgi:release factor glutamine methyltransferase
VSLAPPLQAATTRLQAMQQLGEAFRAAGIDTAQRDARLLLLDAASISQADLLREPRAALGDTAAAKLDRHLARRLAREPVARILGEWEFWSLPFTLTPDTLIPRADSEAVVAAALHALGARHQAGDGVRVLDLGTGSGCLLVALLHELPGATGVGSDLSPGALAAAQFNAARNGVGDRAEFVAADWAHGVIGRFDLVVSNPPYIEEPVIETLELEVRRHEPRLALSGGLDGLAAYRAIAARLRDLLMPQGVACVEIGATQAASVAALFEKAGFDVEGPFADFGRRPRALVLRPRHGGLQSAGSLGP